MKTRSILLVLALGLILFSSCSKINDALTVKVPVDFTNDLQVKSSTPGLKSSSGDYAFGGTSTFNPSTDPTVIKYKAKIKNITASGISYTPSGLPGDVTITESSLMIGNRTIENPNGKMVVWNLNSLTLKNGVLVDLPIPDEGTFADISTILDGDGTVSVTWIGTQSSAIDPYHFDVTIHADVTAYLLKQ